MRAAKNFNRQWMRNDANQIQRSSRRGFANGREFFLTFQPADLSAEALA
jgi:hypothetical protein